MIIGMQSDTAGRTPPVRRRIYRLPPLPPTPPTLDDQTSCGPCRTSDAWTWNSRGFCLLYSCTCEWTIWVRIMYHTIAIKSVGSSPPYHICPKTDKCGTEVCKCSTWGCQMSIRIKSSVPHLSENGQMWYGCVSKIIAVNARVSLYSFLDRTNAAQAEQLALGSFSCIAETSVRSRRRLSIAWSNAAESFRSLSFPAQEYQFWSQTDDIKGTHPPYSTFQ